MEEAGDVLPPAAWAALMAVSSWRGYGREEEGVDEDDGTGRAEPDGWDCGCSAMGVKPVETVDMRDLMLSGCDRDGRCCCPCCCWRCEYCWSC